MSFDHSKEKVFMYKSSIPQKDEVQLRNVQLNFDLSKSDFLIMICSHLTFILLLLYQF